MSCVTREYVSRRVRVEGRTPIYGHPRGMGFGYMVRWLGYRFTPAFNTAHHYRHRLSLAEAIFSFVKCLSSPGAGVRPFLYHRIASGLLLPILTYGADLLTPNYAALRGMNSFWHRVQRWTTNNFYSTPTSILAREACLPLILHAPPSPGTNIPPLELMKKTYQTLRAHARNMLLQDWVTEDPTPPY